MLISACAAGSGALLPADGAGDKGIAGIVADPGVDGVVEVVCGADKGPPSDDVCSDNGIEGSVADAVIGGGEVGGACGSTGGADDCGHAVLNGSNSRSRGVACVEKVRLHLGHRFMLTAHKF